MAWKPSSDESVAAFERALPLDPRVEQRRMFGCPVGLVDGKMFAVLWQDLVAVQLDDADRESVVARGGRPWSPMRRSSTKWITLPEGLAIETWIAKSLEHVLSRPAAKKKRAPRSRKAK